MRAPRPLFLLTLLASFLFLTSQNLNAQPQNTAKSQLVHSDQATTLHPVSEHQFGKLELGKCIEHELKGGEADIYSIRVKRGQFLRVVAEQKGTPLLVFLRSPSNQKIAESAGLVDGWGSVYASLSATATDKYLVSIGLEDETHSAGKYQICIAELRKFRPLDRTRVEAENDQIEASHLYDKLDQSSVRSAIALWDKSLPLWRSVQDRYEEAVTLAAIGSAHQQVSDQPEAITYLSKSLAIFLSLGKPREQSTMLDNLGVAVSKQGRKQEALEYFAQAQLILEKLEDQKNLGMVFTNIGEIYDDLGQYQKALSYYRQALDIARKNGDLQNQASVLTDLGRVNRRLGEMQKALDYYSQALPLARSTGERAEEGVILNNSGLVYAKLGDWQKALELYDQALPIRRELGDRFGEVSTLANIGSVYWNLGEYDKSLDYTFQSLAIARAAGFRKDEANALHNIGATYGRLGEHAKALDNLNQALVLRRTIGDRSGEANTLATLAAVLRELGDLPKALEDCQQQLSIANDLGERPLQALALSSIATLVSEMGDKQKALDYYTQALPLRRAVGDRFGEAATLSSIGVVYQALGDSQKAMDDFNQALEIERAISDRPGETLTLFNLAKTRDKVGQKQEALDNYLQALSLARAMNSPYLEGAVLAGLMGYWNGQKNPSVAIFMGKQSVNAYQRMRASNVGLDKSLQRSFLQSKSDVYRELADLLITQGRLSEAQVVLNLLKEEEYFEFIRRDGASADSLTRPVALTPAEEKTYADYKEIADEITGIDAEWSQLRANPSRTPDEEKRFSDLTEKLRVASERMELYFRQELSNAFVSGEIEKKNVGQVREETSGLQLLVGELGPGTVVLYTLVTESQYRVIVITPNAMQPREYPISQADLRRKVAALLTALENPRNDPLPASQELYKILIAPIEKDLRGAKAKTLMWSLDDVLRYVPIAALNDGKQYVVENYRTVVFTPASIGRLKDQPASRIDRGLGMGVSKDYDGLGSLPQVPEELRDIIQDEAVDGAKGIIPGAVMLDDSFTEKNMEKALEQRHRLVHIASHFVLQPGNESDSYLLLGGKDEGGKGYHLTLSELRTDPRLSFSDTDLLTLSACQTATSSLGADGQEIDGLGMMAQQRGAKAVIATLWSVEDESTALLMTDFYSRWVEYPGESKAEALRLAQLAMLRGNQQTDGRTDGSKHLLAKNDTPSSQGHFSHPYFWAPYILIGNWK
jgi:CHAT domain-containing protein/tetratricopeptide (TPR) repeat protein